MSFIKIKFLLCSILFSFSAFCMTEDGSLLDKLIFNDGVTLPYFAENTEKVFVEISIAPANGAQPKVFVEIGEVESSHIPNTLRDLYTLCPTLLKRVQALMPDDYYLKIQESISEPDSKEAKVLSFIGAYARDIKHVE